MEKPTTANPPWILEKTETQSIILLVDDRAENLLTLEGVLKNEMRTFFKAESGNEALKIALREPLTLILMDIQMPEMDGIETSRLLRMNPRTKHIPILFVSAINPNEKISLDEFEPGTVDFLFKPLNLQDTKTKVTLFEKIFAHRNETEKLRRINQKLAKDFDRFIYMVSHDLKAPLRAITNLSSWIGEDLGNTTNSNVTENLALMRERVSRLNLMLEGILEYSRAGRIEESPTLTNTRELVHSVFESLQPSDSFKLFLNGNWPVIYTEKTKLEKVFRQLIQNAIIHHDKMEGTITLQAGQNNQRILFSVSDDGPGINPIHYKSVFEMFQTLLPQDDRSNPGTGLPIAKKIIEDLGGTISILPNKPHGVTFQFTWPC